MFGPNRQEHEAALQKTATLEKGTQELRQRLDYFQQECRSRDARISELEREKQEVTSRLRDREAEVATIKENMALLEGESPFIKLGDVLYLFTQIHRIKPTTESDAVSSQTPVGHVKEINDHFVNANMAVEDLVRLISAHYRRAQGGQD
jgi:predicted nuclease with TOPRIM domain